jgi:hypothetical protein
MNLAVPMPTFSDIWVLGSCLLLGFAWLIRLEAKVMYLAEHKVSLETKLDKIETKLSEISESLARLEGKFENN